MREKYIFRQCLVITMTEEREPMDVTLRAYEVLERQVKVVGNSGGVGVPKTWLGKKVKVLLLE